VALLVLQREPASLYASRYTPALREAIARHYRRAGGYHTDFAYEIWVPKPR
jgi:aspartate/methionine/tyrosine aminotransferase